MDRRKFLAGATGAVVAGTVLGAHPAAAATVDTPRQPDAFGKPGRDFTKVRDSSAAPTARSRSSSTSSTAAP
jgi:hypothetical protein